jgi:2-iminobutanoate/2-iminopropanoate deaminase
MKRNPILLTMLCALSCVSAGAADRKYIVNSRPADAKSLPFSDGVLAGDTLYIAGHLGLDAKTGQAPTNPDEELRLVMEGVKQTVDSAGLTMDDIVSLQIFCTDLNLYGAFNGVYQTYFHGDYPARAFIGTDKLLRGARFEIMGIAVKRSH